MAEASKDIWPTELRVREQGRVLYLAFDDHSHHTISAELLRVESPSAEVKGHGPGQEQLVWGKRRVAISKLEPIGNYAVRIIFDDGHSTGLFTWTYLNTLGRDQDVLMIAYEAKLLAAGLSR
jgi:DUF971 family protein